ncbi:hypothetical protein F2P81_008530 [Scophthalmus maximus]|uniref:Uncharacterized protein n=1 Tax=Scophthalmus maximus TaxID=52904 RepID=A0A6A4T591_SCOMX|nr:hypothetical protein F2P81_008530 [Scophthalmus maximus]
MIRLLLTNESASTVSQHAVVSLWPQRRSVERRDAFTTETPPARTAARVRRSGTWWRSWGSLGWRSPTLRGRRPAPQQQQQQQQQQQHSFISDERFIFTLTFKMCNQQFFIRHPDM